MKKLITTLIAISFASQMALATTSNGTLPTNPKNEKASNGANPSNPDNKSNGSNPKNPENPDQDSPEAKACEAIEFHYGPGQWECNRNFISCAEADPAGKVICNFSLELVGNVIKAPLNVLEEGAKLGAKCGEELGSAIPVLGHLLGFAVCVVPGALKGAAEGVAGILAGVVEIDAHGKAQVVGDRYVKAEDMRR